MWTSSPPTFPTANPTTSTAMVYGKASLGGRTELAGFFLEDPMLPADEQEQANDDQAGPPTSA